MTDELLKWKSRCASLTAEITALRIAIELLRNEQPALAMNKISDANTIRAQRDLEIRANGGAVEIRLGTP